MRLYVSFCFIVSYPPYWLPWFGNRRTHSSFLYLFILRPYDDLSYRTLFACFTRVAHHPHDTLLVIVAKLTILESCIHTTPYTGPYPSHNPVKPKETKSKMQNALALNSGFVNENNVLNSPPGAPGDCIYIYISRFVSESVFVCVFLFVCVCKVSALLWMLATLWVLCVLLDYFCRHSN